MPVVYIKPAAVITARRSAGLTQEALAELIGASEKTIRNLESGRVLRPYPSTLKRLADALRVPVSVIAVPDEEAAEVAAR